MQSRMKNYFLSAILTLASLLILSSLSKTAGLPVIGLFYPTTFFVAWLWGMGPAFLTIILSVIGAQFLLSPSFGQMDLMRLSIYVVTASGLTILVGKTHLKQMVGDRNQERFRRSIEAINMGVWYCDLPFDKLIWDAEVKHHFWLPPDVDVTIDLFYERIHPEDREMTRKAIEKSINEKGPYDIVYRTTNPANIHDVKYIRAIGWTDYDNKGNPIRFDGITLDHSHLRKVSQDLKDSLEVVETINRVGRSLSGELDQKKLVQQVTDAATQLAKADFGAFFYNLINEKGESYMLYTISGVPMENFSRFPMPRNTEIFSPTFAGEGIIRSDDITKDPRYGKNDTYHGMPKGHLPVVSYLAVPVVSRTGEVIGGLFLGHKDPGMFTEREEKIVAGLASQTAIAMDNARLFEKANEAIRLRDEFLSISSHELKTPLTSLKMQLQLFTHLTKNENHGPVPEERIKKIVDVSERQVSRLNSLVEDLLDVSRISNGKLSLQFAEVDLSELVREVVDRYLPLVKQTHCTLDVNLPPKLLAHVDRIRFEQILINLLSNSMKYAAESQIAVNLSQLGGDVVLSVKDTGPGIHPADQGRIFKRFERVSAREGKGLGLGLYIVHQIVEAHKGSIVLKSDTGKGAEFVITIPHGIS